MSYSLEKTEQAWFGSPFRYVMTRLVPQFIAAHCPPDGAKMLDVGCGSGRYSLYFADAGVTGDYVGVDIDDQAWTDESLPKGFTRRFVRMDAHLLERLPDQFDFAVSLTAFEHFEDDVKVLRALSSVLKKGGKALIVVPSRWSYPLYGRHGFRRYTKASIRRLCASAGMELPVLVEIGGAAQWLFHFLWFAPAHIARLAGKAALSAATGMNKTKARTMWPRAMKFLDEMGQHHLKWAPTRAMHKFLLVSANRLDRFLPFLEVGYLFIVKVP